MRFRDGKRTVPDYMESLMVGIPVHKLTYDQAVEAMNRKALTDHTDRALDRIIDRHFEENFR